MKIVSQTKEYIITALFQLLETTPFDKISVSDVAKRAGVSRMTFYRTYRSKSDVILDYFNTKREKYRCEFGANHKFVNYDEIVYYAFKMLYEEKKNILTLEKQGLIHLFLEVITNGMVANFKENGFGKESTAYMYAGALYNLAVYWIKNDCKEPIDEIMNLYSGIIAKTVTR